ncbi:MAG: glycosyl hydrolase [Desertimonas sp.]
MERTTTTPSPASIGGRSGLGWASGAYVSGGVTDGYDEFASWRGRELDVAVIWVDRDDWNDLTDSWVYTGWSGRGEILSLGIPPYPDDGTSSLAACAAGDYDDHWRAIAAAIDDAGIAARSVIRLGWELNGDWYPWAAHEPDTFVSCWRSVVAAAEEVAAVLRWEWTVAAGPGPAVTDAADAWPGDAWVDIVGLTKYDEWPQACDDDTWRRAHLDGEFQLDHWRRFANAHDLPLAVSEWAPFDGGHNTESPCPDNAAYVGYMFDWFQRHRGDLAYEAYFNIAAEDMLSVLHRPDGLAAAADAYRSHFGSA